MGLKLQVFAQTVNLFLDTTSEICTRRDHLHNAVHLNEVFRKASQKLPETKCHILFFQSLHFEWKIY